MGKRINDFTTYFLVWKNWIFFKLLPPGVSENVDHVSNYYGLKQLSPFLLTHIYQHVRL